MNTSKIQCYTILYEFFCTVCHRTDCHFSKFENEHMGSVLDQLVKLRCLEVYFDFNFFQVEVSGYYFSFSLALLLAQLQCSKTLYWVHFISAIGWKWEKLEKPFEAVSRSTRSIYMLGYWQRLLCSSSVWLSWCVCCGALNKFLSF